jgi:RsiW-degrading membrane proteinase PrsW (M82 family)
MNRIWFWVLLTGIILFLILNMVVQGSSNANLVSLLIILGALVVPIAFVVYFYEHIRDRDISRFFLVISFLVGGGIGVGAASIIEYSTLTTLNLLVGIIEESAKMIFPLAVFMVWRFRHEADGLILGVAVGMGFAALETMGYGFTTLAQNDNSISALNQVLLVRGLLSPAGHAAWTGIICATLWRERELAKQFVINWKVIGIFVLAVALHTTWDIVNTQNSNAIAYIGSMIVAIISLSVLIALYRQARKGLITQSYSP